MHIAGRNSKAGRWILMFAALAGFAAPAPSPAVAQSAVAPQSKVKLEPCGAATSSEGARCGKYEVYEDRQARSGRKIALNILVLPALTGSPKPDPVFYFEGGPGGSAVAASKSSVFADLLKRWRAERVVVFVDQRGTGESNPLRCDLSDPDDMTAFFSGGDDVKRMGKVTECRDKLSKVADLKLYTTPIAMDDLDEVRRAMGYDKINLFGGSYGTRAALVYLRQHGEHVRSVALDGVAPTNFKLPLSFSKGVQNALERLFADCAADESCHKAFPDVKADLEAALARLEKGPVQATAFNMIKKKPQQVTMTRGVFIDLVRLMLYEPGTISLLPLVIHQGAQGEFGGIAAIGFIAEHQLAGMLAGGMSLSVICAEDAPFISESDVMEATQGTYYGESRVRATLAACKEWPRGSLPANYSDPVKSDVPVLIVSGDVDPVTPPWLAADAVRYMPHSRQIVGKNWSHSSMSDCGNRLLAEFISRGSAVGLDASCMDSGKRLPFNTGEVALAPTEHPAGTVKTSYEGMLEVGAQKLRLVLNTFKEPGGKLTASFDSPDQGAMGLAVDGISVKDGVLHFEMKQIGATYDGQLSQDGSEINGKFKQGAAMPLILKKKG
jgi:pimeloyl-ACP methyl ester carboxylesterase